MEIIPKHCVPCQGGIPPIPRPEAEKRLAPLPGWHLNEDASSIYKRFKFRDFALAMQFAQKVGDLAEHEGHHPILLIGWGFCQVEYKTAKIKGLHENDFLMAEKTDTLAAT